MQPWQSTGFGWKEAYERHLVGQRSWLPSVVVAVAARAGGGVE